MIVPFFLAAADFTNFTYATHPCPGNVPVAAVMRKGAFSYFDPNMGTGFTVRVVAVKEGSLRAGTRQAVVVLACDFPKGGTAAAYLYDERKDGRAVLLGQVGTADYGSDWGSGPGAMRIRFARERLYVDAATYALRAGKLVTLGVRPHR